MEKKIFSFLSAHEFVDAAFSANFTRYYYYNRTAVMVYPSSTPTRKMVVFFFTTTWISNLKKYFFWIEFNPTYCGHGLPIQYFLQEKWTYFSLNYWIFNLKNFFSGLNSILRTAVMVYPSSTQTNERKIFFLLSYLLFWKLRMSQLPVRITHVRPSLVIIPF